MFIIYVENIAGEIVQVKTWSGQKEDGIAVTKQEAKEKNIMTNRIWAEKLKSKTYA
jgi:hypothetical protein